MDESNEMIYWYKYISKQYVVVVVISIFTDSCNPCIKNKTPEIVALVFACEGTD